MSFHPAKILLFGATGTIGRYITASLLAAHPPVGQLALFTAPGGSPAKAALLSKWETAGVTVVRGDVDSEADVRAAYASTGADTVVSALGRGVLGSQVQLLRLAEESGTVQWFLPSEYGTDVEYGPQSAGEKPHQFKLQVRRFVRESIRRLRVTYVVTGPYVDMWLDTAPGLEAAGGFDAGAKRAYVVENGEGRIGFCTMWDVGKFVVATLRHPRESFGKALKVQSFVVTPKQVLAEYEKQTGAQWTVSTVSLDELRQREAEEWAVGSPKAAMATLRRIWAEGGTLYDKTDNELIGVGPEDVDTLEVAVKRALAGGWTKEEF